MQTIHLASWWRLDHEKWRARLLPALASLCQSADIPPFVFHIYGDGQYQSSIQTLSQRYPEKIRYHGWQSLDTINTQLQHTHYALMPSLFLETFGLTALESLRQWVPVIGYRKGGLEPFIVDGLNISDYPSHQSKQIENCLHHILTTHTDHHRTKIHTQSQKIASHYTAQKFINHVTTLSWGTLPSTIMMISDYTNPLGGIETHLYKVQKILQSHWSEVIIVGGSREKNAIRKKYAQMIGTARNPFLKNKIQKKIQTHKPDLVRYHSVLRNIGHAGIISNPYGKARVTYHDLGLMHPFPSQVYDTTQIKPWPMGRLSQSRRYQRPFVTLKYISAQLIKKKIDKSCQSHLVPSSFLLPMITRAKQSQKETLEHFIAE